MRKEDVLKECRQDQNADFGEIIEETDNDVVYYDYTYAVELHLRFAECISDDYVKSIIHIGDGAKQRGLTSDYLISVMKKAFGRDYEDYLCTLSGIIIPSNEAEFYTMLEQTIRTSDDVKEWYEYEGDCNDVVGKMLFAHQIVFINENLIYNLSKDICAKYNEDDYALQKEYEIGVLTTFLHEMRHLLMETHLFLSEEEFPDSERTEENVEAYAIAAYESLGELGRFTRKES